MGRLDNKVAVITGAARGIGEAIARRMALDGARVVVADRDGEAAERTARAIGRDHAIATVVDVGDEDAVASLFERSAASFGPADILVNNAGIGAPRLVLDVTVAEWDRILRVNLTGALLCSQHAARAMIARGGGGTVINIVSLSGQKGAVARSAYGASKAGLEILTKIMAVEWAEHGIRVNAIAPGPIATETGRAMHTPETVDAYHRLIPQRRYGEPDDIAAAAAFLASDDAGYVTGHTLNVDGGFLAAGLMFPFDPARDRPVGAPADARDPDA